MYARIAVAALVVLLAGCPRPPRRLQGEFAPVAVAEVQGGNGFGLDAEVRWGGTIVHATPYDEQTCFEIVGRPLDRRAQPRAVDEHLGRFLACAPGFLDPEVYAPKREVTVVGTVRGVESRRLGERDYPYPQVAARDVFLWPERPPVVVQPVPYYGWGWGPGWGWYDPWYAPRAPRPRRR